MKVLRKAFKQQLSDVVTEFVASAKADQAIVEADITGSLAHVEMLKTSGLVTPAQAQNLQNGLNQLKSQDEKGEFPLDPQYEDVHMNVESKLAELIGNDAKLLHTARSRNDQVALDMRIYIANKTSEIEKLIAELQSALINTAQKNIDVVMPGYTHLQRAQPLLFAHIMHSFFEMFGRDKGRFTDSLQRTAISPLGAGALVGSGLPIQPEVTAAALELTKLFGNSVDAVSDRDFVAEFLFAASLTSVHLSQLAETFIIWCTKEFGFILFPDDLTTTSSLMPQKKNPDPMELVRGKTGGIVGELVNVLITLKGLPVGYNRDLQETKPGAIKVAEELSACLKVMTLAVNGIQVLGENTKNAASDPELFATDLVEYLVRKGVAFRAAHDASACVVQEARDQNIQLDKLPLADYKKHAQEFDDSVYKVFDVVNSINCKTSHGGTATARVHAALKNAHAQLHSN
ncbi:MAG TPA: argininosuccinate lyase [Drouetiella sp.]